MGADTGNIELVDEDKENMLKSRYALKLWDVAVGRLERTVSGLYGDLLDISRDNTRAVTLTGIPLREGSGISGTYNAKLIEWDLTTGKEIAVMKDVYDYIAPHAALFSPDGTKFAASCTNFSHAPDILLWDTRTGKLLKSFNNPAPGVDDGHAPQRMWVLSLAFSADGRLLASGGGDGQALVWDVAAGTLSKTLRLDDAEVPRSPSLPTARNWSPPQRRRGEAARCSSGRCRRSNSSGPSPAPCSSAISAPSQ